MYLCNREILKCREKKRKLEDCMMNKFEEYLQQCSNERKHIKRYSKLLEYEENDEENEEDSVIINKSKCRR